MLLKIMFTTTSSHFTFTATNLFPRAHCFFNFFLSLLFCSVRFVEERCTHCCMLMVLGTLFFFFHFSSRAWINFIILSILTDSSVLLNVPGTYCALSLFAVIAILCFSALHLTQQKIFCRLQFQSSSIVPFSNWL